MWPNLDDCGWRRIGRGSPGAVSASSSPVGSTEGKGRPSLRIGVAQNRRTRTANYRTSSLRSSPSSLRNGRILGKLRPRVQLCLPPGLTHTARSAIPQLRKGLKPSQHADQLKNLLVD